MSDTASVSSSFGAFVGRQIDDLNKVKTATSASFNSVLHHVEATVGLRPKTGFTTSGTTYEANTLTGKTKAVFDSAFDVTKSALHIKP
ncbi:MAG TPA: hypothetical protein VKT76_02065 [Bradyrhizobium sp.]|nr:hypothetical protein [Bradyrhizobium sp.]